MKTTLNLALPSSARERYALAWALPVGAVGLLVLVLLGVSAMSDFQSYRRARAALQKVQQEETQMRGREAALRRELERPQLREVYRYSRLINGVIGKREFSALQMLEKMTALLPVDARLDGLEMDLESPARVLRLTVSAEKEESLEKFLVNLEDSPDFADVNVLSHGLPSESESGNELATAACQVRYVGGGSRTP